MRVRRTIIISAKTVKESKLILWKFPGFEQWNYFQSFDEKKKLREIIIVFVQSLLKILHRSATEESNENSYFAYIFRPTFCFNAWCSSLQTIPSFVSLFIVMCLTPKKTKNERFLQTFRIRTMNSNIWLIFQTFSLPIIGIQLFHQWTSGFRPSNGHWTHY